MIDKQNTILNIKQRDLWKYNFDEYSDNYFDGLISDPPYALTSNSNYEGKGFMGKDWDSGKVAFSVDFWKQILRVLKPGAYMIAFGGTRTHHRLMVAIEDAGFKLKDTIFYLYGSGFPKSHNISKAIDKKTGADREVVRGIVNKEGCHHEHIQNDDGWKGSEQLVTLPATDEVKIWDGYGSALKPAYEPCILAQKPVEGTIAQNCLTYGCGGLNIDGCRIPIEEDTRRPSEGGENGLGSTSTFKIHERKVEDQIKHIGRFPANIILDGSDEIEEIFPYSTSGNVKEGTKQGFGDSNIYGKSEGYFKERKSSQGSASRFFYTAKASKIERNAGLEDLGIKQKHVAGNYSQSPVCKTCDKTLNGINDHSNCSGEVYYRKMDSANTKNNHPTVKPLSLNHYLAKLILPPERGNDTRKLLVPFSGSGSEMIGGLLAGWDEIHGFEYEEDYIEIAKARFEYWRTHDLETYKKEEAKKKADAKKNKPKETSWITNE